MLAQAGAAYQCTGITGAWIDVHIKQDFRRDWHNRIIVNSQTCRTYGWLGTFRLPNSPPVAGRRVKLE